MKDFYSLLSLEKNASSADVKKAYFRMVRLYPPDRFPADFMKIREAYEVLSNVNSRKQYDDINNLPEMIAYLYNQAREALDLGKTDQAISLLEQVMHYYPEYHLVKSLLGDAYYANGNSGKAFRIFEELAADAPDNAGYLGKLANSCLKRGWHKKAVDIFRCALDLDEDNLSLWMGLIDCHMKSHDHAAARQIAYTALETSRRKKWDPLELYYYIIQIDIIVMDFAGMKEHVGEMQRAALSNTDQKQNVAWFLSHLGQLLKRRDYQEEYALMLKVAFELNPDDEEIRQIKDEILKEENLRSQIASLRAHADFDEIWPDLFEFELEKCDDLSCGSCQVRQFSMEMSVIIEADSLRRQLMQIRRKYPELFQLKSEFLINVGNVKRYDGLLAIYQKKHIALQREFPEEFPDGPENNPNDEFNEGEPYMVQQQVKRNENKVGRNDPCPCGSGKKYKKCCGK